MRTDSNSDDDEDVDVDDEDEDVEEEEEEGECDRDNEGEDDVNENDEDEVMDDDEYRMALWSSPVEGGAAAELARGGGWWGCTSQCLQSILLADLSTRTPCICSR